MGNAGNIESNVNQTENDASKIKSVSDCFQEDSLNPRDHETTLIANANLHAAFDLSQSLMVSLGAAMDKETSNIRSVGVAFEQYDQMIADLTGQMGE